DEMRKGFTTRASVFATLHKDSTLILADLLDKSGLKGYVGLVNMNRNSPVYLCQSDFDKAVSDTEEFIVRCNKLSGIKPIITPRFIPSVDKPLLHQLHLLRDKYQLKCQSHLDENLKEIDWVKALEPDCESYSQCYEREDLLRNSVMAHCVYLKADERKLLKERKTFIAHCPDSNLNVCSGIAPIREYLDDDMLVGIGTDVAGGCSSSMIHSMALAIQVSKVNTMLQNKNDLPLNISDVFAMATILGGQFFGKVGSFLPGYEFDCLVIDDSKVPYLGTLSLSERLERFVYLGNESAIVDKFVSGKAIDLK
ncbi:MAG: amidohydrolase family protein, partial [Bacilli bacterium]